MGCFCFFGWVTECSATSTLWHLAKKKDLERALIFLVYDGGINAVLIDYRETIKTEDVNEQKTDDRIREKEKDPAFILCEQ